MLELETEERLAQGGEAIARAADGRVVFVSGAAPRERVAVEITQDNKRFLRARTLRVIEPSIDRVVPECKHYEVCGGCVLQHVAAAAQSRHKEVAALETLRRVGQLNLEAATRSPVWVGAAYGYRRKARFSVGLRVGFRARAGNEVIAIDHCPILEAPIDRAMQTLRGPESRSGLGARSVEVEAVTFGGEALLEAAEESASKSGVEEQGIEDRTREGIGAQGSARWARGLGDALISRDAFGSLPLYPSVFAQASFSGNEAMVAHVQDVVRGSKKILELYAGSGNFTRMLVAIAPVVAVEWEGPAVELARTHVDAQFETGDVERVLPRLKGPFDTVVLDPPRVGVSATVVGEVARLRPARVVYVSCDAATLARDTRSFVAQGFTVESVRVFDLYPQTAHVEAVIVLKAGK